MSRLSGLSYYGGKSAKAPAQIGKWIASLLPDDTDVTYVEPYGGMLGVLLQRQKCKIEIANDLDELIINLWLAIRDRPDEFGRRLELTPHSRVEYARSVNGLHNDIFNDIEKAVATYVVIVQSVMHGTGSGLGDWAPHYSTTRPLKRWRKDEILQLAKRIENVQLECRPALEILQRTARIQNAVIYCDPPYPSSKTNKAYKYGDLDILGLGELLIKQKGKVAISGYNDEWDYLGWYKSQKAKNRQVFKVNKGRTSEIRIESLWTNYPVVL